MYVHIVFSSFPFLFGLPSAFWSHLSSLKALGTEELQPGWSPAQPQGSSATGARNLVSRGGMCSHCLSPGMQIYHPPGNAGFHTEWLMYSKHSPGQGFRVWKYSMRIWLHTLTTFTNEYVKQGFAAPLRHLKHISGYHHKGNMALSWVLQMH